MLFCFFFVFGWIIKSRKIFIHQIYVVNKIHTTKNKTKDHNSNQMYYNSKRHTRNIMQTHAFFGLIMLNYLDIKIWKSITLRAIFSYLSFFVCHFFGQTIFFRLILQIPVERNIFERFGREAVKLIGNAKNNDGLKFNLCLDWTRNVARTWITFEYGLTLNLSQSN